MRADSVDDLRWTLWEKFGAEPEDEQSAAMARSMGRTRIPGIALGKSRKGRANDGYRLVAIAHDEHANVVMRDTLAKASSGEIDWIRMSRVAKPRVTSRWSQKTFKTLTDGIQIHSAGKPFVGTGGEFFLSATDPDVVLWGSNWHVVHAGRGHVVEQGNRSAGVVWESTPVPPGQSFFNDSASIALDKDEFYEIYSEALDENAAGYRNDRDSDLNQEFVTTGQTLGTTPTGRMIARDVADYPIGYDAGVSYAQKVSVFLTELGNRRFSAGGHSGSCIWHRTSRMGVARLFAGGPDSLGRDLTLALPLADQQRAVGGLNEVAR